MKQSWHDLLFAHWPIDATMLRPHIPAHLEIDTFEGQAWIAVVPFTMTGVRPRLIPALPWLSAFPELNVRTYVTTGGKPGVWFFSLDADNPVAVWAARRSFHLPYFRARMSSKIDEGCVTYHSERRHRGAPSGEFIARYQALEEVFHAIPGSLEHFLTERYCLYAASSRGNVYRGEIHHGPWPLQRAEADISRNTMTQASSVDLPAKEPLLHFSRRQDVLVWAPQRIV